MVEVAVDTDHGRRSPGLTEGAHVASSNGAWPVRFGRGAR